MFFRERRSFVWSRFMAAQMLFYRAAHSAESLRAAFVTTTPIFSENQLAALIARLEIDLAFLASLAQGVSLFLPPGQRPLWVCPAFFVFVLDLSSSHVAKSVPSSLQL